MRLALGFCSILLSTVLLTAPSTAAAQTAGVTGDGSTAPRPRPPQVAYSVVAQVHQRQMLADGTTLTQDQEEASYFDSHGRSRMEIPSMALYPGLPRRQIIINDPVAGVSIRMDPDLKIARITHIQSHTISPEEQQFMRAESEARRALETSQEKPRETHEQLGESTHLGYKVRGVRTAIETPVGAVGNDRPLRYVQEIWTYSLPTGPHSSRGITMRSITDDPRYGHTEHLVTKLDVGEPDPSVFKVPEDYKVFADKPSTETAQAPQ